MTSIYDYTECHDIAFNMTPPKFANFDEAVAWVKTQMMEGESSTIITNIAEILCISQGMD